MEVVADTSFDDVVGATQAKQILQDFAAGTRAGQQQNELGLRPARGVVLVGPPGTGKTMLARATAHAAKLPIFAVTAAEFIDWSHGLSPTDRVRSLFAAAQKAAPCIVFIDELDALADYPGFAKALGAELDGFAGNRDVFVVAATNSLERLPASLTRSGRFDRVARIYLPTASERAKLLRRITAGSAQGSDVDLARIGWLAEGCSGADLVNLANLAALRANTLRRAAVAAEDWQEAILQLRYGPADDHFVASEQHRWQVAVHEAGHAVAAAALGPRTPLKVNEVTVVARGEVLGHTSFLPLEDKRAMIFDEDYQDHIAVALAGLAAETIFFFGSTIGSAGDLQDATRLARAMVTTYGMSDAIGPQGLRDLDDPMRTGTLSEATHAAVDAEVQKLIETQYEKVQDSLAQYGDAVEKVAEMLMVSGGLDGKTVESIVAQSTPRSPPSVRRSRYFGADSSERRSGGPHYFPQPK